MQSFSMTRRFVIGAGASAGAMAAIRGPSSAASGLGSRAIEQTGASAIPSLSMEALGTLNRFHRIAAQPAGVWDGMGIESVNQDGDDGFHMQLPYMLYALAVAQYGKTPAYRELTKASMNGLIQKMKRNEVWSYWEELSTGEASYGMDHANLIRKAEADPIKSANVMYSGHILPMLGMYEMFYRDGKWTSPDAFDLRRLTAAGKVETFKWNIDSVQKNTVQQFVDSGYLGMECFLDAVFPTTCLLFPLHGLIHYDLLRGTKTASDVIGKHIAAWQKISTLYHMDESGGAPYVLNPSKHSMGLSNSVAFGKTQFMNVIAPKYVEVQYPRWRNSLFDVTSDGMLITKKDSSFAMIASGGEMEMSMPKKRVPVPAELSGSQEQMAHKVPPAALEMGDEQLASAALKFANFNNPPKWQDGELFYERNDERGTPRFLNRRASILLGSSHVWSKNAYRALYERPWGQSELSAPEVQGIDYPNVLVSQAFHDAKSGTLYLTILPNGMLPNSSRPKSLDTTFRVIRLDPNRRYRVLRDGQPFAPTVTPAGDGSVLTVATRLDGRPQRFEIVAA